MSETEAKCLHECPHLTPIGRPYCAEDAGHTTPHSNGTAVWANYPPKLTPHERHVADGYCPAVSPWKSWCTLRADEHDGLDHMSPHYHPDGTATWAGWREQP